MERYCLEITFKLNLFLASEIFIYSTVTLNVILLIVFLLLYTRIMFDGSVFVLYLNFFDGFAKSAEKVGKTTTIMRNKFT